LKVDPVLDSLLRDLRAGRFRPRAIRRFLRTGVAHAVDLAWSLSGLRRSFYMASTLMAVVLGVVGAVLEWSLPGGLPGGIWAASGALFVGVFGMTLLQLGLVRAGASGEVYDRFVLPNVLTLLRLLVVPFLATALAAASDLRSHRTALVVLGLASVTDILDGFLSRRLRQTSEFGRIYDPVVDIVFNCTLCCALHLADRLPGWLLAFVLVRYLLSPVAGTFLYLFRESFQVKSTVMGKVSSFVVAAYLVGASAARAFPSAGLEGLAGDVLAPLAAGVCAVTVGDFVFRGFRILRRPSGRR
jgi:CDP-diacylglycerol--glycerol-3-phosphate 3-phosphatidyltransferase